MSVKTNRATGTNKLGGIVVGDYRRGLPGKVWLLGLVVLIIVAGVIVGIYALAHHSDNPTENLTPRQQSEVYASNGNYAAAQRALAAQLAGPTSADAKATIYSEQVSVALNFKQYQQAQRYAQQAENLTHSAAAAEQLGYVAEAAGDKISAAKYYQLAIDRQSKLPQTPANQLIQRSYKTKLQELGK